MEKTTESESDRPDSVSAHAYPRDAAASFASMLSALYELRRSCRNLLEKGGARPAEEVAHIAGWANEVSEVISGALQFKEHDSQQSEAWEDAVLSVRWVTPTGQASIPSFLILAEEAMAGLDQLMGSGLGREPTSVAKLSSLKYRVARIVRSVREHLSPLNLESAVLRGFPSDVMKMADFTDIVEIEARLSGALSRVRQLEQELGSIQRCFIALVEKSNSAMSNR